MKKLDYHHKKYANPYFVQKKTIRNTKKINSLIAKKRLILIEILIMACGLIWFFFISGVFDISEVNSKANEKISASDIKEMVYKQMGHRRFVIGSQKNLIFFDTAALKWELKKKFNFEWLEIEKNWPDIINIHFAEKNYAAVWQEGNNVLYIDSDMFNNYMDNFLSFLKNRRRN